MTEHNNSDTFLVMIPEIIKKLKPFLADKRKVIAEKTAKAISKLQAKQLFANAYQQYENLNEATKTKILMEISNVCPQVGYEFINKALDDELPQIKAIAIKTSIELNDPKMIQKIAHLINDINPIVRKLAYEYLGLFPLPQISTVLNKKLLVEDNLEALEVLIRSTGNIGNPNSTEYLIKLLEKEHPENILEAIIEALGKIKL